MRAFRKKTLHSASISQGKNYICRTAPAGFPVCLHTLQIPSQIWRPICIRIRKEHIKRSSNNNQTLVYHEKVSTGIQGIRNARQHDRHGRGYHHRSGLRQDRQFAGRRRHHAADRAAGRRGGLHRSGHHAEKGHGRRPGGPAPLRCVLADHRGLHHRRTGHLPHGQRHQLAAHRPHRPLPPPRRNSSPRSATC